MLGKAFGNFSMKLKDIRRSLVLFLFLTAITGALYPLLITGIAQLLFPHQANGSLIVRGNRTIGSELLGQSFTEPRYFWGRPSATEPSPYTATASSGSNLGPLNPALIGRVEKRLRVLRGADSLQIQPVPVDLVTSSGSGLDPHISPLGALYQVPRVARSRGRSEERLRLLIRQCTEEGGFFGEPRVNVLRLNIALDSTESSEVRR